MSTTVCGPNLGDFLDGDVQEGGARIGGGGNEARRRGHGLQGLVCIVWQEVYT